MLETRFKAKVSGEVLVLASPADLDATDVALMTDAAGPGGATARQGFVWDLGALPDALPGTTADPGRPRDTDVVDHLPRVLTAVRRRGAHVVFINGEQFTEYYNRTVVAGGYLENYETEEEGVAAVTDYLTQSR